MAAQMEGKKCWQKTYKKVNLNELTTREQIDFQFFFHLLSCILILPHIVWEYQQ